MVGFLCGFLCGVVLSGFVFVLFVGDVLCSGCCCCVFVGFVCLFVFPVVIFFILTVLTCKNVEIN